MRKQQRPSNTLNQLYQTLEDRNNPEEIENKGPFKCRTLTSWLGEGYYFWDGLIELAHFWGKNSTYSEYVICSAEATLNDSNCYNLISNIEHLKDFRNIVELMEKEGLIDEKTTVRRIITFMIERNLFQHYAIKAIGTNSIADKEENKSFTLRFKFDFKLPAYLDIIPPIQICIFNCQKVGLTNYKIIHPDIYVESYLI